ncbi:hypothetical protein MLD38_007501 [Melastoma candidum]|uniref:Uncharacterized protein n=1 Tax=Melastoma candidum TaxID=119954 RepID=A0ACB9RT96_9MYRT|nr:hypothetical protein MLD38_007501 [Melastoma candidum]
MDPHTQRMRSYVDALEEEKRKIQVFHRELPLCLDLVNKAIENYRQQLSGTTTEYVHGGHSECSEHTWPVLEEFIPIKRPCSGSDCGNEDETEQDSGLKPSGVDGGPVAATASTDNKRKSDWLRSAQLWNQTASDPPPKDDPLPKRVPVLEVKRNGGAFQPFNRGKDATVNISLTTCKPPKLSQEKSLSVAPSAATSSTADTVAASTVSSRKEEREPAQPHRKQRRNWSPELHRRFLQALQQLGGSHAATPKQIRELMKVDGLTNDEVKSHLQKYRLHTRRPGPTTIPDTGTAQGPQFLVVGGIWVPPTEYAAVAATAPEEEASKPAAVYAPPVVSSLDDKKQPDDLEGRGTHSTSWEGGEDRSNSPATSSSTHTSHNHRVRVSSPLTGGYD